MKPSRHSRAREAGEERRMASGGRSEADSGECDGPGVIVREKRPNESNLLGC